MMRLSHSSRARLRALGRACATASPSWPSILCGHLLSWHDREALWYARRLVERTFSPWRCTMTSVAWRRVVSGERALGLSLVRGLDLRGATLRRVRCRYRWRRPDVAESTFRDIVSRLGPLTSFAVDRDGVGRRVLPQLEIVAQLHPGLGQLTVRDVPSIGAAELVPVLRRLPRLWRLDLRGCAVAPFALLDAVELPNLGDLRLDLTTAQRFVLGLEGRPVGTGWAIGHESIVDEVRALPAPIRRLFAGDARERAVLQDFAAGRGLRTLAHHLSAR